MEPQTLETYQRRVDKKTTRRKRKEVTMKEYDYLIVGAGLFEPYSHTKPDVPASVALSLTSAVNAEATYTAKTWKAYMYTNTARTFSTQTIKKYGIM